MSTESLDEDGHGVLMKGAGASGRVSTEYLGWGKYGVPWIGEYGVPWMG